MNINTSRISTKNCYVNSNNPKYIVIHETDNYDKGANAERHAMAQYNGNLGASVHYYVDDHSIYKTLEHYNGAWAVGDGEGRYGITNRNTINIEICVNPDNDYEKSRINCIELVKYLIKQTGISADRVVRHYDASRKPCPRKMINNPSLWEDFKNKIQGKSPNVGQQAKPSNNKDWDDSVKDKKAKIVNIQSYLNVRYEPNGKIIGSLNNGAIVTLWRREGDWYHIYSPVKGYNQAYVHKDYIQIIDESAPQSASGKCTPTTELNVRSGPGSNFKKIGVVYPGGELQIHEQNGSWHKISYVTYNGNTKYGWISSSYVRKL